MKTRGRPFKEPHQRVSECINSRLTQSELKLLEDISANHEETKSRIIRRLLVGCLASEKLQKQAMNAFDLWCQGNDKWP